ncbi:MAG: CHAT domain-containing protein [Symploca sp. SIO1A3]|nr:CHAT domain-containing protein [Symploca sp. SIO1A3]
MSLLELRFYPIEGKEDGFKVSVEGSLGEVHHEPVLPFLDRETPNVRDRCFTVVKVLESTKFREKDFSEDEQAWMVREQLLLPERNTFKPGYLATIGRRLYDILGSKIQQVIEAAVAEAKRDRIFLHIRLRFPANDPKPVRFTDYPWELLHNEYGFLAHQGVTFSRYIAYRSPRPNLPPVERLNVLLVSSGAGDERMGLKSLPAVEQEAIANGLQQAQEQGNIQLETLASATLKALRRRLQHQTVAVPQVLHFDGHGFFGKRCNEAGCRKPYKQGKTQCECGAPLGAAQGYLVFEDSNGKADYVSAKELGELLGNLQRREQPHSEPGIALVVLSACKSGMSRKSESVFNGVAQNLIGGGIPAVVAMTYSIRVDAASEFAESFYRSVGEKESLAIALRRGQSAMGIEGNQWYRPVLYLRWEDNEGGQLFKSVNGRQKAEGRGQKVLTSIPAQELPLTDGDFTLHKVPLNNKTKVRKKTSRVKQLRIEILTQEFEKLEQDLRAVAQKQRRESNPQERNNLELQLQAIANQMENIEQQLNELEDGDE